jgi:hypothetical protein
VLSRALQTTRGRLVVLLGAVAVVLLGSAALAHFAFDLYAGFGDAVWRATVHLLDPSSLQDDEGGAARTIGLFQVVTGLVLLVGLLFTFVSETVGRSLERLGQSDRPVRARGHLLIVGSADLAPVAARAAADATRLRPAFERIVVLAPESARESREQLRGALEEAAGGLRVDLVFGDTGGESGFELAAAEAAAVVLLMPARSGPVAAETADVETTQAGVALAEYLEGREAAPRVCLLFRRGRNVDAAWELVPDAWEAVVGDRTVTALLRLGVTRPEALVGLPTVGDAASLSDEYPGLVRSAWQAAESARRPLRLAIVGCSFDAPALMEDLAEAGAQRFEVTVIAERDVFDRYLGEGTHSGIAVRFIETRLEEPERLAESLAAASPDAVIVTPSPRGADLRTSDAATVLALLRTRQIVSAETPIVAEFQLPTRVGGAHGDPRLLPISSLLTVTGAIALTVFDPAAAQTLEQRLSADAVEATEG